MSQQRQPNLLFIHTDQQHHLALSALGNRHVRTPHMDRLVQRGACFTSAFSANPVCCPARACWYTGRTASENGMLSNNHRLADDMIDLGQWFRARGYRPVYVGKWHIPGRNPAVGFDALAPDPSGWGEHSDRIISRTAQGFLQQYRDDRPFFLSLGFMQPHDCCYWLFSHGAIDALPHPQVARDLPPVPPNGSVTHDEPPTLAKHTHNIRQSRRDWNTLSWQYYIWSYYRMVEMVDAELGRVLDALESSPHADNTLIVFTADHGDGLGQHGLASKWYPYDSALRVPLVICPPDRSVRLRIDQQVVSGLDIAPTLCDYAGIGAPPHMRGRSLRPLVERRPVEWRPAVVSESNLTGRVIITPEYKLAVHHNEPGALLFDRRQDLWEKHNLAASAQHADTLARLSQALAEWEQKLIPASA